MSRCARRVLLLAALALVLGAPIGRTDPAPGEPSFFTDFTANDGRWLVQERSGPVAFAVPDSGAGDRTVASLALLGDRRIGPADRSGPGFATQIATVDTLHFGTYRARVQLAACRENEEAVNGFFVYANDGRDRNGNGIADNSEIDIEVLCGTPSVLSLTTWTDYEASPERFRKWSRSIDLATGAWAESVADDAHGQAPRGVLPGLRSPGFPRPDTFYEMGFEWHPSRIRWFIVLDGHEVTLWDFTDARYIPQQPAQWMFNLWHAPTHWFESGGPADFPGEDAVLRLDWARYTPAPDERLVVSNAHPID